MSDAFPTLSGPNIDVNLIPNSVLKGVAAGNAQKTPIQAAVEGVTEGVKTGIQTIQGVQQIQANDQNAQIRQNTINQLPTANALQDAQLAGTQTRNSIEANQLQVDQATQQAEIDQKKAQSQTAVSKALEEKLNAAAVLKAAQDQSDVYQAFDSINQGNVDEGTQKLAALFPKLVSVGITHSGKDVGVNQTVLGQMTALTQQAQATGDPAVIQRAQKIVDQFNQTVQSAQSLNAKDKDKVFNLANATQPVKSPESEVGSSDPSELVRQQLARNAGDTTQQPSAQRLSVDQLPQSIAGGTPITAANPIAKSDSFSGMTQAGIDNSKIPVASTQPPAGADTTAQQFPPKSPLTDAAAVGEAAKSVEQAQANGPIKFGFPAQEGELDPLKLVTENPNIKKIYEDTVPEASRLLTDQSVSLNKMRTAAVMNQMVSEYVQLTGHKPDDDALARMLPAATTRAASMGNISDKDIADDAEKNQGVIGLRDTTQQLAGILARVQKIKKEKGYVPIGASESLSATLTNISKLGLSDDDGEFLDQVKVQLDTLGRYADLQKVRAETGSVQAIRTNQEQAAMQGLLLGMNVPLEKNVATMLAFSAEANVLENANKVKAMMIRAGKSYAEASIATNSYLQTSPPIITQLDTINGQPYATGNHNPEDPAEFVNNLIYHGNRIANPNRLPNGRVSGGMQPAQPKDLHALGNPQVADRHQSDNSGGDGGSSPAAIKKALNQYDALDVPDTLPNGASAAFVARISSVENSKSDPNVESEKDSEGRTAKGLMQFRDATGKEWWAKVYPGQEYTPKDPVKSLVVGQKYLTWLLAQFGGETRPAAAAYRVGPRYINDAIEKALKATGDGSWENAQLYLEPDPKTGFDPRVAIGYVNKVMGDDKTSSQIREKLIGGVQAALGELATPDSIAYAQENLSNEGLAEASKLSNVKTTNDVVGTILEKPTRALLAPPGTDPNGGGVLTNVSHTTGSAANSFLIGATRQFLLGGDDEIFAGMRMGLYGENYSQAIAYTRQVKEQAFQDHPWFWRAGMVVGSVPMIASRTVTAVFEATPKVAMATLGGIQGFLEGEGDGTWAGALENRGLQATLGAILGLAFQAAVKPVIGAATGVVNATARTGRRMGLNIPRLPSEPVPMTPGEARVSKTVEGVDLASLDNARTEIATDPEANLGSTIPEGGALRVLETASKQPKAAAGIRKAAGQEINKEPAQVKDTLNQHTQDVTPEKAAKDLGKTLRKSIEKRKADRAAEGNTGFDAWRAKLPGRTVPGQPEKVPIVRKATDPELEKLIGKVNKDTGKIEGGHPEIVAAVKQARSELTTVKGGKPARNDADVLRRARTILGQKVSDNSGDGSTAINDAFSELTNLMTDKAKPGGAEFTKAVENFKAASDHIKELTDDPAIVNLLKATNEEKVLDIIKAGDNLFKIGAEELRRVMGKLTPDEQQYVKNAVRGYVQKTLDQRGERPEGAGQIFPNFTKYREEFKAIFGDTEGNSFMDSLVKQRKRSDVPNAVLSKSSPTAPIIAEAGTPGKKDIGEGVAQSVVGTAVGSIGLAMKGIVRGAKGLKDYFTGNGPMNAEVAREISKIVMEDRVAGITFLNKEIAARAQAENWGVTKAQIKDGIRRLLPSAVGDASNFPIVNRTQPQTSMLKEQMRRKRERASQ